MLSWSHQDFPVNEKDCHSLSKQHKSCVCVFSIHIHCCYPNFTFFFFLNWRHVVEFIELTILVLSKLKIRITSSLQYYVLLVLYNCVWCYNGIYNQNRISVAFHRTRTTYLFIYRIHKNSYSKCLKMKTKSHYIYKCPLNNLSFNKN